MLEEVEDKSSTSSEAPVSPVKLEFDDVDLTPVSDRKRGYADGGGGGDDSEESASKPKRMREDSRDDKEKSMCARCSGLEAVSEDR